MHPKHIKVLHWAAIGLITIAAIGYVARAASGHATSWRQWAIVALLLFNSIFLGLARDRFSMRTLAILGSFSAAAGFVLLLSLASAWPFS